MAAYLPSMVASFCSSGKRGDIQKDRCKLFIHPCLIRGFFENEKRASITLILSRQGGHKSGRSRTVRGRKTFGLPSAWMLLTGMGLWVRNRLADGADGEKHLGSCVMGFVAAAQMSLFILSIFLCWISSPLHPDTRSSCQIALPGLAALSAQYLCLAQTRRLALCHRCPYSQL
jgi:hypothetical protein